MTGGLLDFFTLEASEYVEQLDGLVSRAVSTAPDVMTFGRTARALRGSATMAKVGGIANVAEGLARMAKGLLEGTVAWTDETRGAAVAAIDDVKILIRGVRAWGPAEDELAKKRIDELLRVAPIRQRQTPSAGGTSFLAASAADAAAGLLTYAENPGDLDAFADVMRKVRALRGVAALKDLPPLPEVVDALDAAAKPIELGQDASAERRLLFRTAARVLLEGSDALKNGGAPPTDSVAVREFAHASTTLSGDGHADDVVPIADLLMDDPVSAVQPAANPPTTAAQRFRLEVVSQAEHLRRLVADGRRATDAATRERLSREVRASVRALARGAQSFGHDEISNLFIAAEQRASALQPAALDVLDRAAVYLSNSESTPATLAQQFRELNATLSAAATAPAPAEANTALAMGAPSGQALHDLLGAGLHGLAALSTTPIAAPVVSPDDDVIPIEDLIYDGKSALQRAIELGDQLRAGATTPDATALGELYDLLQLAAAE